MMELGNILLAILPMLLLIGAWFVFVRQMQGKNGGDYMSLQRRQVEALERIAAALESRR
jgi:ATP-dependent Zn protease